MWASSLVLLPVLLGAAGVAVLVARAVRRRQGRVLGVVAAVFTLVATGVVGTQLWARAAIERSQEVLIWRKLRTASAFVTTA